MSRKTLMSANPNPLDKRADHLRMAQAERECGHIANARRRRRAMGALVSKALRKEINEGKT